MKGVIRSLAVHHQSLAFRARLYDAKNEAPGEEAGISTRQTLSSSEDNLVKKREREKLGVFPRHFFALASGTG